MMNRNFTNMKTPRYLLQLVLTFTLCFTMQVIYGQTNIRTVEWTGAVDNSWTNPGNWLPNTVPVRHDLVIIPATDHQPVLSGANRSVGDLQLMDNVTLTVNADASLLIAGEVSGSASAKVIAEWQHIGHQPTALGVPMANYAVKDLAADQVMLFDGAEQQYIAANQELKAGDGVLMAAFTGDRIVFEGIPNTGIVSTTITGGAKDQSGTANGFNLIGNPFLAGVKRTDFVNANRHLIDGNIWLWASGDLNSADGRSSNYIVVNNTGVASVAPRVDELADIGWGYDETQDLINPMQGFYVLAQTGANQQLVTFNAAMQATSGRNRFREMRTQALQDSTTGCDRLRFTLTPGIPLERTESVRPYSEVLIGLETDATFGEDYGWDAPKLFGEEDFAFYSLQDEKAYTIQALPRVVAEEVTVDLGFMVKEAWTFTINVTELLNPDGQLFFLLEDRVTGSVYNLKQTREITFEVNKPGTINDRFVVRFAPGVVTSTSQELLAEWLLIHASTNGIKLRSNQKSTGRVAVYQLNGAKAFDGLVSFQNQEASINIPLSPNQVYVIRMENEMVKVLVRR